MMKYRHISFFGLFLTCVLFFHTEVERIYAGVTGSEQLYQNALFPLIAIWFVYRDRKNLKSAPCRISRAGLVVSACCAIAAYAAGRIFGKYSTGEYAVVAMIACLAWGIYGGKFARRLGAAFFFLFLTVPPPNRIIWNVLPAATYPERAATAWIATKAAVLLGVPAVNSGVDIFIGDFTLVVAMACSGVNYLIGLTGVMGIYLGLAHGPVKKKALLILFTPVLSLAGNIVRVFLNITVAGLWGEGAALFYFHYISGVIFSGVIILLVMYAGGLIGIKINPVTKPESRNSRHLRNAAHAL